MHFEGRIPSIQDRVNRGTISKDKLPKLWSYFADVDQPAHWGLPDYPPGTTAETSKQGENVIQVIDDTPPPGYVRLQHLSVRPSMGPGSHMDEAVQIVRHLDVLESWVRKKIGTVNPERIKIMTGNGHSMKPTIQDEDLVFVDMGQRTIDAQGIYVIDVYNRLLLKKALILSDGTLVLRSDNIVDYPDEERIDLRKASECINIAGKVLAWWTMKH
ncbi:MAG: HTH-type transcriptional regulator PrtR [Delftia tsuruhatensis]|nr:MAG: HTH-type transcriptional regulator PrtR [Delftia tsuruhatensis]